MKVAEVRYGNPASTTNASGFGVDEIVHRGVYVGRFALVV